MHFLLQLTDFVLFQLTDILVTFTWATLSYSSCGIVWQIQRCRSDRGGGKGGGLRSRGGCVVVFRWNCVARFLL